MSTKAFLLPAAMLLTWSGVAAAEDLVLNCAAAAPANVSATADPASELDELLQLGKLGGKACEQPLCKDVQAWKADLVQSRKTEADKQARAELEQRAGELLSRVYRSFNQIPDVAGVTDKAEAVFKRWQLPPGTTGEEIDRRPIGVWRRAGHTMFSGTPEQIALDQLYARQCSDDKVGGCPQLFSASACVLAHAQLQLTILDAFLADNREAFAAYLQNLDARWQAYRNEGRSLYPWEIALNEWLLWDYSDAAGFSEPPREQLVFLHPDPALRYAAGSSSDDRLREAVTLEVIGFDRWKPGREGSGLLRSWTGLSVIAAWAGEDAPSWGLMTHWQPNLGVGLSYGSGGGDSRLFLLVTADLGKFLTDPAALRERLAEKLTAR